MASNAKCFSLSPIADDSLSRALVNAKNRKRKIGVIAEADTLIDKGTDLEQLRDAGISVALEKTEALMHHKFTLFDRESLATGSLNWTWTAMEKNFENLMVFQDTRVVRAFKREFDTLWKSLTPQCLM